MNFSPMNLFRLDGRVAIVTGGSKGLGKAMAAALAGAGANVVVVSRHGQEAQTVADAIKTGTKQDCLAVEADVSLAADVERIVQQSLSQFGHLDILVNNAGINRRAPIESLSEHDMRQVWETNVLGPWLLCRAAAASMREQRWGRVINIGSLMSTVAISERTPYATSTAALAGLTRTLALEWAMSGITVNTIAPGPFYTEMNEPLANDPERFNWFTSRVPMGRWGQPDELAGAVIFLASEASSFVTGALLTIDGGWTAQ